MRSSIADVTDICLRVFVEGSEQGFSQSDTCIDGMEMGAYFGPWALSDYVQDEIDCVSSSVVGLLRRRSTPSKEKDDQLPRHKSTGV